MTNVTTGEANKKGSPGNPAFPEFQYLSGWETLGQASLPSLTGNIFHGQNGDENVFSLPQHAGKSIGWIWETHGKS